MLQAAERVTAAALSPFPHQQTSNPQYARPSHTRHAQHGAAPAVPSPLPGSPCGCQSNTTPLHKTVCLSGVRGAHGATMCIPPGPHPVAASLTSPDQNVRGIPNTGAYWNRMPQSCSAARAQGSHPGSGHNPNSPSLPPLRVSKHGQHQPDQDRNPPPPPSPHPPASLRPPPPTSVLLKLG